MARGGETSHRYLSRGVAACHIGSWPLSGNQQHGSEKAAASMASNSTVRHAGGCAPAATYQTWPALKQA